MLGVYVAIAALTLTILGLIVKITVFSTEIRVWVDEMRKETRALRGLPLLEMRVGNLEKQMGVSTPEMSPSYDAE